MSVLLAFLKALEPFNAADLPTCEVFPDRLEKHVTLVALSPRLSNQVLNTLSSFLRRALTGAPIHRVQNSVPQEGP